MDIRETAIIRRQGVTDMPLAGQKALVTGANSGIGKAVALAMAEAGASPSRSRDFAYRIGSPIYSLFRQIRSL